MQLLSHDVLHKYINYYTFIPIFWALWLLYVKQSIKKGDI